jgi:hypothetical protein
VHQLLILIGYVCSYWSCRRRDLTCDSDNQPKLRVGLHHALCYQQVANAFASKFYDVLAVHPEYLSRFYKSGSTLTITDMHADGTSQQHVCKDMTVSACCLLCVVLEGRAGDGGGCRI